MSEADDKIRCDACPVMCYIRPGMTGACDRYANEGGLLVRVDPHVMLDRTLEQGGRVAAFAHGFSELAHFSRSFKKAFGVNPHEMLKR